MKHCGVVVQKREYFLATRHIRGRYSAGFSLSLLWAGRGSGWVSNNSHGWLPLRHHPRCWRAAVSDRRVEFTLQKDLLFVILPWLLLFRGARRQGWRPDSSFRHRAAVSHSPSPSLPCIHCSKNSEIGSVCVSKGATLSFNLYSICFSCPPALLSPALELDCSLLCLS